MARLRNAHADRWDWDQAIEEAGLPPPFPRGISHADVDCEIEVSGNFLVVEGKREHEGLSTGQARTMDARVADGRTCLVVYGDPPGDIRAMQWWGGPKRQATVYDYWSVVQAWCEWAEAHPRLLVAA